MLSLLSETGSVIKISSSIIGLVFAGLFAGFSCGSQNFCLRDFEDSLYIPNAKVTPTPTDRVVLEQKAELLTELYEKENCVGFFKAFPDNFDEFEELYGYSVESGQRSLFSKYPEHFPYFFNCSGVADKEKLAKVIRLGIGGKYSDKVPVDLFHDQIVDLIKRNPAEAKRVLDNLPDEKAKAFWYFLFDRPHPGDREVLRDIGLLKKLLGEKSKQAKLLSIQHRKLLAEWGNY